MSSEESNLKNLLLQVEEEDNKSPNWELVESKQFTITVELAKVWKISPYNREESLFSESWRVIRSYWQIEVEEENHES